MNRLLFLSNLFPRPDAPRTGQFNLAFAVALNARLAEGGGELSVVVPVPEWRVWRWSVIRKWQLPEEAARLFGEGKRVCYVPCFYIPIIGRSTSFLWYSLALRSVMHMVTTVDGVIASWLYPDAVAASRLARRLGKPFWVRLHGSDRFHLDAPLRSRICRRTLSRAEGVMVNANFMKQELIQRGISEDRITIIPNGIDRRLFYPDAQKNQETQCLLWVGNLVMVKCPDIAIAVFADFTAMLKAAGSSGTRHRLVMIGQGPMRQDLERLSSRLGLEKQVLFTDNLPQQEVAAWMRKASVLLLTSQSEGMPNVVKEALACGTPVVSTNVGDVGVFVQNGVNGFVINDNDKGIVREMAAAVNQTLQSDWTRDAIASSITVNEWSESAHKTLSVVNQTRSEGQGGHL